MGGKPSNAIPSNRPESGGADKDNAKKVGAVLSAYDRRLLCATHVPPVRSLRTRNGAASTFCSEMLGTTFHVPCQNDGNDSPIVTSAVDAKPRAKIFVVRRDESLFA